MKLVNSKINKNNKKFGKLIKTGNVIYLKYILLKEDEIKVSNFIGLCILKKNKSNTIVLKNNIKKENVTLLMYLHSPLIVEVYVLKKYKRKFRLSKLYYKNN